MKKVFFKLTNGEAFRIIADSIEVRDDMIYALNGELTVAIFKKEIVDVVCVLAPPQEEG